MSEEPPMSPTDDGSASPADDARPPVDGSVDALVSLVERGAGVDLRDQTRSDDEQAPIDTERVTLFTRESGDLVDGLATRLVNADALVAVLPRVDPTVVRAVRRAARPESSSTDVRIVFAGPARARLRGPRGAAIRAALASRSIDWYASGARAPVGFLLADDRPVVGGFDGGRLETVLSSTDDAVCSWVAETCRRYPGAADSTAATTNE